MEAKLLVLCAIVALAAAGPMRSIPEQSDSCALTCSPSSKFRYSPGQTFLYDYSLQTHTSVDGASEEQATLDIRGQADIEVIEECEMVLLLRNIEVRESRPGEEGGSLAVSPSSGQLGQLLQKSPLRFAFQDGVVGGLCPGRGEDSWALNVKRGLLSALQNSMDFHLTQSQTVRESDVAGQCSTDYEVQDSGYWGGSVSMKRRKDLQSCTDRQGFLGSLHTSPFQKDPSGLQSLPLLQSEQECEQTVSEGVLHSSVCRERHLFRPFSAHRGGALTTVLQTLTFRTQRRGVASRKDWVESRAEMTFDHGYSVKDSSEARARAESLLAELCQLTVRGVQEQVPRVFAQLVGAVRGLDHSDLRQVYSQLQAQSLCRDNSHRARKFYLDALPMAGSSEAVDMMKDLMVSGDVTGLQADLYLASLAFIPQPTDHMLDSVKALLTKPELRREALLSVSAMVQRHCGQEACSSRAVDALMDLLATDINHRCSVNDGNIKTVLTSLRALGNAGQPQALSTLRRCLGNRVPLEVRVAAAEAFRRLPCDVSRRPLEEVVRDQGEDTELRSVSYLQLVTCPSPDLLPTLQDILDKEPEDSQVGSFIHSHLANLQETSSPLRQSLRQMLQGIDLSRQFPRNPLKFSRNYEKSAFLPALNSGAQAESQVLFSAQSPVPRSVSTNLTVDVLGHSINLLEIGGRLEGVEYLLESVQEHFLGEGKDKASRSKLDDLKGSGYARIFGNELLYNRFQGLRAGSGKNFNILDFLIKLSKDHDYTFTQSLQFLDSTVTTPTAGGLPLTLRVNGTATVDLKAAGRMDLRKVSKSPRTLHIEGQLRPSGAMNLDGVMSVDGLLTGTGLKVSTSLLSSLALQGRVELDRGRTLNVQLDMPDDQVDIFHLSSKFFIVHNKAESEQKMITANRREYEMCTGSVLSAMTGLEMCGQLQFPNASMQSDGPFFPLTGPSSVSVVLHKRDSHSGYKLLAKRVENKRSSIAQLSFDTPGSSVVRAVSFDLLLDYPQREAELSFASPWKKTSVKGSLVWEAGLQSVTGSVVVDDDQTLAVTAEMKVAEDEESGATFLTPRILLRRPGADDVKLRGDVNMAKRLSSLSTDLTLTGLTRKPLQLQASYKNTRTEKGVAATFKHGRAAYAGEASLNIRAGKNAQFRPLLTLSTPRGEVVRVEGQTDWRQNKMMLKSDHTLTAPGLLALPINLKCDIKKRGRKKGPRYDLDVRLKSKPFTGKVSGVVVLADTAFANLRVDYNANRLGRDRLTLTGKLSDRSTNAFSKYTLTSTVEFKKKPDWNMDAALDLEHKRKRSGGTLTLVLGKNRKDDSRRITLGASMARNVQSLASADVDYKLKAVIPMMDVNYALNGDHSHSPNSLSSKVTFRYQKDKEVKAAVNMKGNLAKLVRLNGDASLSFPGHSYEVDSSLKKKGKQLVHALNMKSHQGSLLTLTSSYKPSKDDTHQVTSNLNLQGYQPVKVSGMVGLDWNNLQLQTQAMQGPHSYSLSALSKLTKGPRGKWTLDLASPSRAVALSVSGGLRKMGADLDMDLAWDKGRDKAAKMSVALSGNHKSSREFSSTSGKLEVSSPFTDRVSAALSLDSDRKRYGMDGKVTVGGKANSYFSTLNVLKPVEPGNLQATWTAGTPLRGWKKVGASVDHVADSQSFNTALRANRGKEEVQLTLTGRDKGHDSLTDLAADAALTSSFRDLDNLNLALTFKNDGSKYTSGAVFTQNKDRYSADLDMTHHRHRWQLQNSGELRVASPDQDFTTTWQHSNANNDVSSTLTSTWGRGQKLMVEVAGSHSLEGGQRTVHSQVRVQTPWRRLRDLSLQLEHAHSGRHCRHEAALTLNGEKAASSRLDYRLGHRQGSGSFALTSPLTKPLSGSLEVKAATFPFTLQAELLAAPAQKFSLSSAFSRTGDSALEGDLRLTTPYRALRSLALSASSSRRGEDVTLKGNLDLGNRHNYDALLTLRPQTLTLGRVAVHTPHAQFSSLDAGYQLSGQLRDLTATADFSLQPLVGKYSSSLTWQVGPEVSGKLRVDTPLRHLRYLQLTATSTLSGQGRRSRLEAEYYPRQKYAVSSFYSTRMPLILSLQAETPLQGYDSLGVSLKHQHDASSLATHGELQYLPDKVIEGTLALNWDHNLDGSFTLKTPFRDFEESKLSLRHDGELSNFKSHAEMQVKRETLTADAQFKYGYTTVGAFSLESSLSGVEKVEVSFNKRGRADSFRSSASAAYGEQKVEGELTHKFNRGVFKTDLTFTSPFTQDLKSSVNLSDKRGTLQATLSGQYGPRTVQSVSSLVLQDRDVTATSSLHYNLDGSSRQVQASVSKRGDLQDLEVTAALTSPFTQDIALTLQHTSNLPAALKTSLSGTMGDRYSFQSDNAFSSLPASLSVSSVNSYRNDGPLREASLHFSQSGDLRDLAVSSRLKFGEKEISVESILQTENGINGSLQISTPFQDYRDLGLSLSYLHTDQGLQERGSLTYRTGRTLQYSLDLSHSGLQHVALDASLTTPLKGLQHSSLKLRHDVTRQGQRCTGLLQARNSALGQWGVTYNKEVDGEQMTLQGTLELDGDVAEGRMEWVPLSNGYKHTMELRLPRAEVLTTSAEAQMTEDRIVCKTLVSLPPASLTFEAEGSRSGFNVDLNGKLIASSAYLKDVTFLVTAKRTGTPEDFGMETEISLGREKVTASGHFKRTPGDLSGDLKMTTPWEPLHSFGGSLKHSGDPNRFTSELAIQHRDKEVSGKVTFYRYTWRRLEVTAELNTPLKGLEFTKAEYRHTGAADSFSCSASLQNSRKELLSADLRATLSPKYDVTLTLKTPVRRWQKTVAEVTLETLANSRTFSSSLDLGGGRRFALESSLESLQGSLALSGKVQTPLEQLPSAEVGLTCKGQPDDFAINVVLNTPQTDVIKLDSLLKYTSLSDLNAVASLTSGVPGMQDLRVELRTGDQGSGSKNGHVMLRWAPNRQSSLDGTYEVKDAWNGQEVQADLTLHTPFPQVRSANLHVQHEHKDGVYIPKVDLTLNGESLLDAEGELKTGDNPSLALITRSPRSAQVTGAFTRDGHNVQTDLFLNWDRDQNDHNLRLEAKAKDIRDDYQTNLDYSFKVIHPSRTVSTGVKVVSREQRTSSEGFLALDDRADSRLFYTLLYNDNSHYYGKAYDGSLKLGVPGRSLEAAGSFNNDQQTSSMDASFSWDADRDVSKQVGVNAKVTKGDKTKADLFLRLPAIGKEVHIDHEMALNEGRTVYDGKTALSYSPDSRRTLTLTSSLRDISDHRSSGKNYSLELSITHPHTNTDVTFNSHLGATGDRLSAAMDAVYLTSRRRRLNMMLRGEIDRLRRQMDLQLDSPMKQMTLHGEVKSTDPYVIQLTNTYDHDVIESQLEVDVNSRSLQFSSNYDLNKPEDRVEVRAGYLNASAISAHLDLVQGGQQRSEGSAILVLETPTLLHAGLLWTPQSLLELEDYLQRKTSTYSDELRESLSAMLDSTGQEVSDKYTAVTEELASELTPLLNLLEGELADLGQQMEKARKTLFRMYRRNDLRLQDVGEYVKAVIDVMKRYTQSYTQTYSQVVGSLRAGVQAMSDYDIRHRYTRLMDTLASRAKLSLARTLQGLEAVAEEAASLGLTLWQSSQQQWRSLTTHPDIQRLQGRVYRLGQDYRWLMGYVGDRVTRVTLPQLYTNAIYNARAKMAARLSSALNNRHVQKVKAAANEVYQQGSWAYNYWEVEERARQYLKQLMGLLGDLVQQELEGMTQELQFFRKSKVTTFDPDNGRVEVEVVLPLALRSLQELPDLTAYLSRAEHLVDHYLPDKDTVLEMYNKYAPWLNNTIPEDDLMSQFENYRPSRRMRGRHNPRVRRV